MSATIKSRGRPPTGKGTPVQVRLQPPDLDALDAWRAEDGGSLGRPEVIRRIIQSFFRGKVVTSASIEAEKARHGSFPDTPSTRLIGGAYGFLRAATLLYEDRIQEPLWAQCFINIGLATELGLKAYLFSRGMTRTEIKAYKHDLSTLLEACVSHGFKVSHPAVTECLSAINPSYKDMSLRYMEGDPVQMLPPIPATIAVVRLLLGDLANASNLRRSTSEQIA